MFSSDVCLTTLTSACMFICHGQFSKCPCEVHEDDSFYTLLNQPMSKFSSSVRFKVKEREAQNPNEPSPSYRPTQRLAQSGPQYCYGQGPELFTCSKHPLICKAYIRILSVKDKTQFLHIKNETSGVELSKRLYHIVFESKSFRLCHT